MRTKGFRLSAENVLGGGLDRGDGLAKEVENTGAFHYDGWVLARTSWFSLGVLARCGCGGFTQSHIVNIKTLLLANNTDEKAGQARAVFVLDRRLPS